MIGMPRGLHHRGDLLEPDRRQVLLLAEQHDHRDRLVERAVQLLAGVDLDDTAADHPHRLVIGEALLCRNDHAIDHAVGERQAQHLDGSLPATQAAVPSATAAALPQVTMPHSAPVSSAMRRPAASISSSRLTNRREASSIAVAHLRQHQAAAMHRAHAAAIDERTHAEREVGVGVHLRLPESRCGIIAGARLLSLPDAMVGRYRRDRLQFRQNHRLRLMLRTIAMVDKLPGFRRIWLDQ